MKTKPFTLVVCPGCGRVLAIPKDTKLKGMKCGSTQYKFKDCYKLGLKKIEETGEEIWVGVKE